MRNSARGGPLRCLCLLAVALTLFGCGRRTESRTESEEEDSLATAPVAGSPAMGEADIRGDSASVPGDTSQTRATAGTDASILATVRAANTVEVRNARIAKARTANQAVQAFATQMIDDHGAASAKVVELAQKLGVTPVESAVSRSIVADGDKARAGFQPKTGEAFDRAYIDNEIATHQAILDLMDRNLIPRAGNAELKTWLQTLRATLVAHLDHANHVQSALVK